MSPHDAVWYHRGNDLEAVRVGRWKLHPAKQGVAVDELYDLDADVGETTNCYNDHADVVAQLLVHAKQARAELGDARLGLAGSGVRPVGDVADVRPLTTFDPDHPYYKAEYDLPERG